MPLAESSSCLPRLSPPIMTPQASRFQTFASAGSGIRYAAIHAFKRFSSHLNQKRSTSDDCGKRILDERFLIFVEQRKRSLISLTQRRTNALFSNTSSSFAVGGFQ